MDIEKCVVLGHPVYRDSPAYLQSCLCAFPKRFASACDGRVITAYSDFETRAEKIRPVPLPYNQVLCETEKASQNGLSHQCAWIQWRMQKFFTEGANP